MKTRRNGVLKEDEVIKSQSVLGLHGPKGEAEPAGPGRAPTIEYRTVDKTDWGPGAWRDEPDKRQWADADTGLPCLIVRGPMGALCGYVGVAPGHPAHGKNYDHWSLDEDGDPRPLAAVETAINAIRVHGGLTYAAACGHGDSPAEGICHKPGEGEPDTVWWFGFDCAHYGDACPGSRSGLLMEGQYRDLAYVEAEVGDLAAQLARLAVAPEEASPRQAVQPIRDDQTPSPNPIRKEQKL